MKKKFEQGAIETVIAIGVLILLGISVIAIPYFMGKNKQTVSTRAWNEETQGGYLVGYRCYLLQYDDNNICENENNTFKKVIKVVEVTNSPTKKISPNCERGIATGWSESRKMYCVDQSNIGEINKLNKLAIEKKAPNNIIDSGCSQIGGYCLGYNEQRFCTEFKGKVIQDKCLIGKNGTASPPCCIPYSEGVGYQTPSGVSGKAPASAGTSPQGGDPGPIKKKAGYTCVNSNDCEVGLDCDYQRDSLSPLADVSSDKKICQKKVSGYSSPGSSVGSSGLSEGNSGGSSIPTDTSCSAEQKKKFWYANNNTCSLTNESYCSLDTCQKGGAEGFQGKPCYETESDCKSKNPSNVAINTGGGAGTVGQSVATKKYYYDGTSCKETLDAFSENSACTNALQDYSSWMKDRTCFDNQSLCKQINEKNITFSELKGACNQNNINISWKTNTDAQRYALSIHNIKDSAWSSYSIEGEDARKTSFSIAGFGVAGGDYEWTLQAYNLYDQPRSDAISPQKISCGSTGSSIQPPVITTNTTSCPHRVQGDANCDNVIDMADIITWIKQYKKIEPIKPDRDARFGDDQATEVTAKHFSKIRENFGKGTPEKPW